MAMSVASADLPAPGGPIKVDVSFAASTPLMSHCFLPAWSHSRKYVSLSSCRFVDLSFGGTLLCPLPLNSASRARCSLLMRAGLRRYLSANADRKSTRLNSSHAHI